MSNYNPFTFTFLVLLRSIPAALLHRFFLPHQRIPSIPASGEREIQLPIRNPVSYQ